MIIVHLSFWLKTIVIFIHLKNGLKPVPIDVKIVFIELIILM